MANEASTAGPSREATMRVTIVEQFQAEIAYKEEELLQIEDRIKLAKLMLQRLRMGVLAQHYGSAGFYPTELDYSKENIGAQGSWDNFEQAVLNGPPENEDQDSEHTSKESTPPDSNELLSVKEEPMDFERIEPRESFVSKLKQEQLVNGLEHQEQAVSTPDRVHPVCINKSTPAIHENQDKHHTNGCNNNSLSSQDSRFYHKKRIIVGNTSQFLDPAQCGGSTHKWMAYVRGSQTEPDISHFVKAVRFFLHPSYHPHDIILVSNPPFHLTKLGWGEFPVRVQLEFSDPYNKPVDIIHNLVLDRTHTGHQTLGAETVVDLDLSIRGLASSVKQEPKLLTTLPNGLSGSAKPLVNGLDNDLDLSDTKELSISEPHKEATHIKQECSDNGVTLNEEDRMDVSPVVTSSPTAARCCAYVPKSQRLQENPLIVKHISFPLESVLDSVSLDHDYCSNVVTEHTPRPSLLHMPSRESSVATSETTSRSASTPQVLTTNLDKCLHLAARNIPLYGRLSPSEGFMLAANSLAQFQSWSIGRRRASEWMRAVAIRQQVEKQLRLPAMLTTKQVLQWTRRNGYTPLDAIVVTPESGFCKCCGCQLQPQSEASEEGPSIVSSLHKTCSHSMQLVETSTLTTPYSCFSELLSIQDRLNKEKKLKELNQEVDVCTLPEPLPRQSNEELMPRFRIPQTPELKWIQQTAANIGIRIYPAVIDRMYAHVVEHMIYMSCARFLRSILLQGTQEAGHCIEGELSNERIITPRHVHQALCNLESCDFVTNKYLGVEGRGEESESSSSDSDSD